MGASATTFSSQRLPINYRANKFNHVGYVDIENIHLDDATRLAKLKLFEINLAGNEMQRKKITAIRENLTVLKFNCVTFNI